MKKIDRSDVINAPFIKPIIVIPNFFTSEECDTIIEDLNNPDKILSEDHAYGENGDFRISARNFALKFDTNKKLYNKVQSAMLKANKENFLYPNPKFPDPLFSSEYLKGDFRTLHHDGGYVDDLFYGKDDPAEYKKFRTRKLTTVIQLTDKDEYVGGRLKLPFYDNYLPEGFHEKGSMIIFAAHLLHHVEKVKSGTRYTLINFMCSDYKK